MKAEKIEKMQTIPEGVEVSISGRKLTVKGPKGEVVRAWDNPRVKVVAKDGNITINAENATNREKKDIHTLNAHVKNIFRGVVEGHTYKIKVCSGHFPMNVSISNNEIAVKNFLGEKIPRKYKIKPGADVKVDGDIITIESVSKEIAGDVAASIERVTRITNRDRRIFQDGLYIIMKDGKDIK